MLKSGCQFATSAMGISPGGFRCADSFPPTEPPLALHLRTRQVCSTAMRTVVGSDQDSAGAFGLVQKRYPVCGCLRLVTVSGRDQHSMVLQACKADGYSIVGVEQTSGSVRLPDFAFDPRTVLVLGNEMTGAVSFSWPLSRACCRGCYRLRYASLPAGATVATDSAQR